MSQTGQIDFTGQVTGQSTLTGERRIVPPNGDFAGTTDYLFTGTIDGIGTGTITSVDEWTMVNGNLKFVGDSIQIVSGTGDFEGMTGTTQIDVKTSSLDGSAETNAGTATFNLVLPRSG